MVMAKINFPRDRFPTPPRPMPMPQPFPLPHKIDPALMDSFAFSHRDKDRSGDLSIDEFASRKDGTIDYDKIEKFQCYDADGDGKVSKKEWAAGRQFDRLMEKLKGIEMPKFPGFPKHPHFEDLRPTPAPMPLPRFPNPNDMLLASSNKAADKQ